MGEERAKFQDIEDFLKALATGIAEGNKALEDVQTAAASEFGTLVVKEGEISAQFEISSLATKAGAEVPQLGLGVRTVQPLIPVFPVPLLLPFAGTPPAEGTGQPQNPFLGMVTETSRRVSEAKITLKLVRVAPTPEEPPIEKRVLEPNLTVLDPGRLLGTISTGPSRGESHGEPIPSTSATPSSGETSHPPAGGSVPTAATSQPPSTPAQTAAGVAQPPDSVPKAPPAGRPPRTGRGSTRGASRGARQQPTGGGVSTEGGLPPEMRQAAATALGNALATLSTQVPFLLVNEQQRRSIIADLDRVGALLEQGNIEAATQEFARFAQQYGAAFGTT